MSIEECRLRIKIAKVEEDNKKLLTENKKLKGEIEYLKLKRG
ncbi:hypothetical protein [Clostridium botulinum]|nr:hypothetical protein [Clostridium botulinum]